MSIDSRKIFLTAFLAIPVLLVACDLGMSIHQVKSPVESSIEGAAPVAQVAIDIKTTHQLIGESWYDAEVKITNTFSSPITITGIELSARNKTYPNDASKPNEYPRTIQAGTTEIFHIMFWLENNVQKTFQQPAELQVHYKRGEKQGITIARIIGGSLSDAH